MAQPVRKSEALESFRRIRGDRLVDRFYELFLHSDERIRAMFAETDFARQKQMLQHGILMLLGHSRGDAIGGLALKRLGQRHHGELGVEPELYKNFADCLIKAVAELDPEWSPRLERAWRADLERGIGEMRRYGDR